jgi:hypothetical protein
MGISCLYRRKKKLPGGTKIEVGPYLDVLVSKRDTFQ